MSMVTDLAFLFILFYSFCVLLWLVVKIVRYWPGTYNIRLSKAAHVGRSENDTVQTANIGYK